MTVTNTVLFAHIVLGTAGLILGPVAMTARKRPGLHTKAGEAYHWVMLGVCVSAGTLAVLDWRRIWWFLPIAVGSYAFALLGYVAARRRWDGWLRAHLTGQGGAYIAMVTALFVVNWETLTGTRGVVSPWAWALPTVVGSPLIVWVHARGCPRKAAQTLTSQVAERATPNKRLQATASSVRSCLAPASSGA